MTRRASDLLQEMQDIFGNSFGSQAESLTESSELSEGPGLRQGKMRKPMPSPKGDVGGKKDFPFRSGKKGKNKGTMKSKRRGASAKEVRRAAARADTPNPDNPGQQKKDKAAFRQLMKKGPEKRLKKDAADITPGASDSKGEGGGRASRGQTGKKTARRHFPFKRSANLGPGPRGRHHDETKCWKCKCGNVYSDGCTCVSSGKGENCPDKGTVKKIRYKKDYKRTYNDEYHAWRARKGGEVTRRLGATRTAL